MHKFLTLKAILSALIGTTIASSLVALPIRADEDNFVNQSNNTQLSLDQSRYAWDNRFNRPEPTDDWKKVVGITGLAIGTGAIGWHLTRAYKPSFANNLPISNTSNASLLNRVSPKLRQELLRLAHSPQIANRLLSGTLNSHPDRSPNWLAEKVIYDLRRDRS